MEEAFKKVTGLLFDEAYRRAMSSGYIPVPKKDGKPQYTKDLYSPSFWQALGKTMGWDREIDQKKVGEKIKSLRKQKGMRQTDLGKELGYSAMGISNFEQGIRTIKVTTVYKMADFFGKDYHYFLDDAAKWKSVWHSFIDALSQDK